MEFWTETITRRSWEVLKRLQGERDLDFIVIGGWAVYLYTKALKSQDLDIILRDYGGLDYLKREYSLKKNQTLRKYEIIIEDIDVDVYLPYYSRLIIPCEHLREEYLVREGFKVLKPEFLLILKQSAAMDRRDSIKGMKDRADILALMNTNILKWHEYRDILGKYRIEHFLKELKRLVRVGEREYHLIGLENPREIRKTKKRMLGWMEGVST